MAIDLDAQHIAYAALTALSQTSEFDREQLSRALKSLDIDPASMDPAAA